MDEGWCFTIGYVSSFRLVPPVTHLRRKNTNAQMHYFTQHYRSPKSSVKNSAEETDALQSQLPIRNFYNISHLAI